MSTSSSEEEAEGGRDGGGGGGGGAETGRASTSRIRRRFGNRVWPAPFLEALAAQVTIDASLSNGRVSAAPSLCSLFQVCSTWRAVSRSDLLWQNLTRRIWNRSHLLLPMQNSWREEFIFWHRTTQNFRLHRYIYTTLQIPPPLDNNDNNDGLSCRRLALSDHYIAAGLSNGSVSVFHLPSRVHLSIFYPHHRDRLGRFSISVSGIILSDAQLVFASLDGDIHVAIINGPNATRRAHLGDVVNDGALVDFTGCNRWWVGLYAGVPGRAFRVWNSETEELVFVGGSLTDPEAVMGWHLLTEQLSGFVGRIRVTSHETAMTCTSVRVMVFDLRNQGVILGEEEFHREIVVGCVDARDELFLVVDSRGVASVRRIGTLEEVCRFMARGVSSQRGGDVLGCINGGFAVIFAAGVIRVWDRERGENLYSFRERIGSASALVADERYVAGCSNDGTIHLWDFGAQ
ncbi:OLC1v1024637C1 [Oldenlandia corymbosa var. corymbosa]|uniref:OLC1v1024637C1 n=1 Tax=Oldenlandia corymbosa var. corymbosa TaxID=529605 RepID=A0AAV1C3N3_OLDCO|nr:OLC1v1024637C1 [Oldenlandia corymbosa var. corymbosa]